MDFDEFFATAWGAGTPYAYQRRLATEPWPDLIDVPTGLGKTAAVAIAWMYRVAQKDADTPRRLVWCLPMRTLVEQTTNSIRGWAENAAPVFADAQLRTPTVHTLMGGVHEVDWEEHPEHPAAIIGTQDMLISRALMRGYGMSRYGWPVHFAALHNDALWVFDETQLMGVTVETSAQLDGLRAKLETARPTKSIWMSATLGTGQLETVDHQRPAEGWRTHELAAADTESARVAARLNAQKPLDTAAVSLTSDNSKKYPKQLAETVLEAHQPGTLTLVIMNRVERAQDTYKALLDAGREESTTALLHSRFRPADRERNMEILLGEGDRIVVSTQVVEAGMDVSATTMFSEVAPWASMVQRFGRCNRDGQVAEPAIHWVSIEDDEGLALPYTPGELSEASELLSALDDAGPASLREVQWTPPDVVRPILRRKDLVDLFDTTRDLAGNDLDVSRYIRDDRDTDVRFFWRDMGEDPIGQDAPAEGELCAVSISKAKKFVGKKKVEARVLDPLQNNRRRTTWVRLNESDVIPGMEIMLTTESGGYEPTLGWTGSTRSEVTTLDVERPEAATYAGNETTDAGAWVRLTTHLQDVAEKAGELAAALQLDEATTRQLQLAGRWHDVGKAHAAFQHMLTEPGNDDPAIAPPNDHDVWAKSNHRKGSARRPSAAVRRRGPMTTTTDRSKCGSPCGSNRPVWTSSAR